MKRFVAAVCALVVCCSNSLAADPSDPDEQTEPVAIDPHSPVAPRLSLGDLWQYRTTPRRQNSCNASGRFTHTTYVQGTDNGVYTLRRGADTYQVTQELSVLQDVAGTKNIYDIYNFPIALGKRWNTVTWANTQVGVLRTELTCEHEAVQKVQVPAGEFDVFPIVCTGRWNNVAAGTSDRATYRFWYAPSAKAYVKSDVVTWYRGEYCADHETVLLNFTLH